MCTQKLEDRIFIITGASSGIGEGIAKKFLEQGAKVMGCGIEEKASIQHENFVYQKIDVTDYRQAEELVADTIRKFGTINGLVNCAGVTGVGTLETTTPEEFSRQFSINVNGVFNMCKAAIGELKKHKDSTIVNIASDLGVKPIPERVAYCPTKAAVIMLTKCIAVDYGPNVRANCIMPGLVETPMIKDRILSSPDPDAFRKSMADMYILKRMGTIEDMANAALFLSCPDSSFVTGDEMAVCGGGHL